MFLFLFLPVSLLKLLKPTIRVAAGINASRHKEVLAQVANSNPMEIHGERKLFMEPAQIAREIYNQILANVISIPVSVVAVFHKVHWVLEITFVIPARGIHQIAAVLHAPIMSNAIQVGVGLVFVLTPRINTPDNV